MNKKNRGFSLIWILLASAVVAGLIYKSGWITSTATQKDSGFANDSVADKKTGGKRDRKPLVVAVATVQKGDIKVYQKALGTVVPFATVSIKSRVAGQLEQVVFHEGQTVKSGELLAQIDPKPFKAQLDQFEGQLERDKALLLNAKLDLERYQILKKQDSIANQQVDTQRALVKQYEGTVLADQGNVDNARLQLSYTRITAPISGRMGLRQIDNGNMIATTDILAVLNQISPIAVTFSIPEEQVNIVEQRMRVQESKGLLVEAWNKSNTQLITTGRLLTLDNQIDATTGTIKLKASFQNQDNVLFPNQFVNVKLLLNTLRQVIVVPVAAIQHGRQGDFVYVVKPDQTLHVQTLTTDVTEGDRIQVVSGLTVGDQIVISGFDKLREGAKVKVAGSGHAFSEKHPIAESNDEHVQSQHEIRHTTHHAHTSHPDAL